MYPPLVWGWWWWFHWTLLKTTIKKIKIKNQIVPASMALCLELAYPITNSSSSSSRDSAPFRHRLPLNSFIDSILKTVYHASAPPPEGHGVRRQIIFTSSSPDACAAVNWKQPNCQSLFIMFCSNYYFFILAPHHNIYRPSSIRVILWRSRRESAKHYYYNATHWSVTCTWLAFVKYKCGGRVLQK